jgi:arylsulfatase A-like enzyme
MIRAGEWKLIYYHGQPSQLFNLDADPDERIDRAGDPSCQAVLAELTAEVLHDWDPAWIETKMAQKKADVADHEGVGRQCETGGSVSMALEARDELFG